MPCSISRRTKSSTRRSISRSTSDAGTSNGTRAASCFMSAARRSRSAACRASCSRSSRTRARSASSVSKSPRSFANSSSSSGTTRRLIPFTVTAYVTAVPASSVMRVVGRIGDREGLRRAGLEAQQLLVEPRRVRLRAQLDADVGVRLDLALGVGPHEIEHDRVAVVDAAVLNRLVPRGAIPQPLERLIHRRVLDRRRRARERDRREVARIERRERVERRRERQRLALLHRHVADVGRVDRLDAPLAQHVVHRRAG